MNPANSQVKSHNSESNLDALRLRHPSLRRWRCQAQAELVGPANARSDGANLNKSGGGEIMRVVKDQQYFAH